MKRYDFYVTDHEPDGYPNRYPCPATARDDGDYVLHSEVAALEAENARLRAIEAAAKGAVDILGEPCHDPFCQSTDCRAIKTLRAALDAGKEGGKCSDI